MRKFIKKITLFCLLLVAISYLISWLYEWHLRAAAKNETNSKELKWQAVQDKANEYDLIFLGSSRGYTAYNPQVIDSILDIKSFNMGTGSQNIIESYYILKEILAYQHPKMVIYELFLPSFQRDPDYYHVFGNGYYMTAKVESQLVVEGYGLSGVINYVLPILRFKSYMKEELTNLVYNEVLVSKNTKWIEGYNYDETIVDSVTIAEFPPIYNFDNTAYAADVFTKYLDAMTDLCRKNGITLIGTRAPYPPSRMAISPPDSVHVFLQKQCRQRQIPFLDFNYMEDLTIQDRDFSDRHHLNVYGATKVSSTLAKKLRPFEYHAGQ